MKNTNDFINNLSTLSKDELKLISKKILQMLRKADGVSFSAFKESNNCRKCSSSKIVKFGKDKNGNQRYKCQACGCTFVDTSFSVVSHSHCSFDVWERYIELLLTGASLHKCAELCGISYKTSFIWRHKILNMMQKDQDNRCLGGIVEIDEMFFSISYKGNHKKFALPRKPYKRGTDSRGQTSERACVMCALERNGQTYGEVLGKGQPTINMLTHAFNTRILCESIVFADKSRGIKNYFNNYTSLDIMQFESHTTRKGKSGPPEVRGSMHIQTVNNLHSRIRGFIKRYNGVSTKYLNHYISLFIWLENHKKLKDHNINSSVLEEMIESKTYISANDIFSLPPIPMVA